MTLTWNQELGFWGEAVAKRYLLGRGYGLVDQNVQFGHKEVDLVMKYGKGLVFVEVKTKVDNQLGEPASLVTNSKLKQVVGAAEGLLASKKMRSAWGVLEDVDWYVDVIAVYGDGLEVKNLLHFENVTMWL